MKHLPESIIALCMFILMSCNRGPTPAEIALNRIDYSIALSRAKIDSLRGRITSYGLDSMRQHPQFREIIANQPMIDSISQLNDSLMTRAYEIAHRNSQIGVVPRTPALFTEFKDVPAVRRIGWKYLPNRARIEKFNKQKESLRGLAGEIQTHCDSVVLSKMYDAQKQLDSLLNKKRDMLYVHQK